jgi:anti-sigma B factor antagonist
MTTEITKNAAEVVIRICGRLDTVTAPTLEKTIQEEIGNLKTLILDMKDLEYISSAGLRVLLSAQKNMQKIGTMKVVNVSEAVMEVFDITGFTDILTIE